jgi:hypothetical protein
MAHDFQVHLQAQELCIKQGLSLKAAAQALNLPVEALKRWAVKEGWKKLRAEYRTALLPARVESWIADQKMPEKRR